jgi:hypothetical protein
VVPPDVVDDSLGRLDSTETLFARP